MAKSVIIKLTTAGTSVGPFNMLSDADSYVTPFETNVSRATLVAGYTSSLVPNAATIIRALSSGSCTQSVDLTITSAPTTTTTTTTTSTTSTTTTAAPTTTTSTTTTTTTLPTFIASFSMVSAYDVCNIVCPNPARPVETFTITSGGSTLCTADELTSPLITNGTITGNFWISECDGNSRQFTVILESGQFVAVWAEETCSTCPAATTTSTTSTTTTEAPTTSTTTTTTTNIPYTQSFYTGSSLSAACAETNPVDLYYNGALQVGTILYQGPGYSNPVVPTKYCKVDNNNVYVVGIPSDEDGKVTEIVSCPTTTTTTTTAPPFDYYYADEIDCNSCSSITADVLVKFTGGSSVTLNKYYRTAIGSGVYLLNEAASSGTAVELNSLMYNDCASACPATTTTTTTSTTTTTTTAVPTTTTTTTIAPGVAFGKSTTTYGSEGLACNGTVTGVVYQDPAYGTTPTVGQQLYTDSNRTTTWTPPSSSGYYLFQYGGSTKWAVSVSSGGVITGVTSCDTVTTTTTTTTSTTTTTTTSPDTRNVTNVFASASDILGEIYIDASVTLNNNINTDTTFNVDVTTVPYGVVSVSVTILSGNSSGNGSTYVGMGSLPSSISGQCIASCDNVNVILTGFAC